VLCVQMALALGGLCADMYHHPAETWGECSKSHISFCVLSCFIVYAMSAFWFKKIHNGLMKHLNGKGTEGGAELDKMTVPMSKPKEA